MSEDEQQLKFQTDGFINEVIIFIRAFNNNAEWLLEEYASIADKLIIDNRDSQNPQIKNAITELDKWIAVNIDEPNRGAYFGRFYERRHSIVLNTYINQERDNVDQILKSGQSVA